jgi:hypothetical protein
MKFVFLALKEAEMKNKKVFFRICLLVFTGIACSSVSRIFFGPASSQNLQPTMYSLNDALTLANQTIQAEAQNSITQNPVANTLVYTQTPEPTNANIDSQIQILGEHHVASGETLSCIGRGYGVLPKAIADVNGIDLLTKLEAGHILKIPAVQWTNITKGPACPPQFAPPNWDIKTPKPTKKPNDGNNANEPPATEPPSNAAEGPSISIPRCPPICDIWPIDPPATDPPPNATRPP